MIFVVILRPYCYSRSFDITIPLYNDIILLLPWHIFILGSHWNMSSSVTSTSHANTYSIKHVCPFLSGPVSVWKSYNQTKEFGILKPLIKAGNETDNKQTKQINRLSDYYLLFDETSDFNEKLPAKAGSPCRVILTLRMIACLRKIMFLLKLCILNRMLSTLKIVGRKFSKIRGEIDLCTRSKVKNFQNLQSWISTEPQSSKANIYHSHWHWDE